MLACLLVAGLATEVAGGSDWWSRTRLALEESEYAFDPAPEDPAAGTWEAPNRAQGLRIHVGEGGLRLEPRRGTPPAWWWSMQLMAAGGLGRGLSLASPRLSVSGDEIVCDRGGVQERFRNRPEGLALAIELSDRPGGAAGAEGASVWADLATDGTLVPRLAVDGRAAELLDPRGVARVRLAGLRAWDAAGRALPVWLEGLLEPAIRGLRIRLNDREATYPVTIEAIAQAPVWEVQSDQAGAFLGVSVASAGDVNGDGFSDVIVGARNFDDGEVDEGRAFLYLGGPGGLQLQPSWTADGGQVNAYLGVSVACAGDVNGDGYSDVVVGVPGYDGPLPDEGAAWVYLGSPTGLAATPAWQGKGGQAAAFYGVSVSTAGDVNGDGYADVLVGADFHEDGEFREGRALVYHGSPAGLAASPSWWVDGDQVLALLGESVSTAGDVNGDGYADVIIGVPLWDGQFPEEGQARVYHGSPSGLGSVPAWIKEGRNGGGEFGFSVNTAGDVNGDGFSDVIIGAVLYESGGENDEGWAFAYHGSAEGLSERADWTMESNQTSAQFGFSVATAGDVNGDGFSDVLVGAVLYDHGEVDEGRAYAFHGSPKGIASIPTWTVEADQPGFQFGWSLATAGDVNGDGFADVVMGSPYFRSGEVSEGRAAAYLGGPGGISLTPAAAVDGPQANAGFGAAVAMAGDVDGDGFADFAVGAPGYDNGEADAGAVFLYRGGPNGPSPVSFWSAEGNEPGAGFGAAVAGAGDITGDGFADLAVGAPGHSPPGLPGAGRVVLFRGGAGGPTASPVWQRLGEQAGGGLGTAVAAAGDVNGDGFGDLIVGEPGYTGTEASEGRALLFRGWQFAVAPTPMWTAQGGSPGARFGMTVAGAGDVNADGFSDLLVGAPDFSGPEPQEGTARLFLGSASGPATAPQWSYERNEEFAQVGAAVAGVGDVDGDGFADVLVGAPALDGQLQDDGGALLFRGSGAGLLPLPVWIATGGAPQVRFGAAVAGAGDLNGDGFADFLVGAPDFSNGQFQEGRAFAFLGSTAGPSPVPAWTVEPNQPGAGLGSALAGGDDLDGDGFADVVVGTPGFTGPVAGAGRAEAYAGNDAPGMPLRPRQRRADDSRPIARLGTSDAVDGFRLGAEAHSPFGRGRVTLEWEVKPAGLPLDGTGLQTLPGWEDSASGIPLTALTEGLPDSALFHWRARLRYHPLDSPFQRHGRWMAPPWGGIQEAAVRTAIPPVPLAGRVPDGTEAAQPGLQANHAAGGAIRFTWGSSCRTSDDDFALYEGSLGDFAGHAPLLCSTGGLPEATVNPSPGNRYYLVVPHNGMREGSYGVAGDGSERPASAAQCLLQAVGVCP